MGALKQHSSGVNWAFPRWSPVASLGLCLAGSCEWGLDPCFICSLAVGASMGLSHHYISFHLFLHSFKSCAKLLNFTVQMFSLPQYLMFPAVFFTVLAAYLLCFSETFLFAVLWSLMHAFLFNPLSAVSSGTFSICFPLTSTHLDSYFPHANPTGVVATLPLKRFSSDRSLLAFDPCRDCVHVRGIKLTWALR